MNVGRIILTVLLMLTISKNPVVLAMSACGYEHHMCDVDVAPITLRTPPSYAVIRSEIKE